MEHFQGNESVEILFILENIKEADINNWNTDSKKGNFLVDDFWPSRMVRMATIIHFSEAPNPWGWGGGGGGGGGQTSLNIGEFQSNYHAAWF